MDWLWQHLVQERLDRILHSLHGGRWQYSDVIFILTVAGACLVALVWVVRKMGGKQAAEEWEKEIRDTSKLAEREGWHSVLQWHRKFGYDSGHGAPTPNSAAKKPGMSWFSAILLSAAGVGAIALIAWATR
jgi:hypothetical protein